MMETSHLQRSIFGFEFANSFLGGFNIGAVGGFEEVRKICSLYTTFLHTPQHERTECTHALKIMGI